VAPHGRPKIGGIYLKKVHQVLQPDAFEAIVPVDARPSAEEFFEVPESFSEVHGMAFLTPEIGWDTTASKFCTAHVGVWDCVGLEELED
jgi:hypothetical protein